MRLRRTKPAPYKAKRGDLYPRDARDALGVDEHQPFTSPEIRKAIVITVLSEEAFRDPGSVNGRELHVVTETARLMGCRIVPLPPQDFVSGSPDDALTYLPSFDPPIAGVWVGYIPPLDWYSGIYNAAEAKGVQLVNSPAQHQLAMEFDRAFPLLGDLTPESRAASSVDECLAAGRQLGFPLFVRGAIKSNKERGWSACVAQDETELGAIASTLLEREQRSRGKVIVRRLVKLNRIAEDPQGFPLGREYRVFVHRQTILAVGFYWEEYEEPGKLTVAEAAAIRRLAIEANRRLGVPFVAIDIAQLENGDWTVIETNEAQFAGLSQVPVLELWSKIKDIQIAE